MRRGCLCCGMPDPFYFFLSQFAGAAGKSAAGEGVKVLRELVGLEEQQIVLMRAVDLKVNALLAGPFHTGRRQVRDALAEWRDTQDRERLLVDARTSFTQALGQDHDHLRRSLAALYLAGVWLALRSEQDVRVYLAESHREALMAVMALRSTATTVSRRIGRRADSPAPSGDEALRPMLIFANEIALTRQAWGETPEQAPPFRVAYPGWGGGVPALPGSQFIIVDPVQLGLPVPSEEEWHRQLFGTPYAFVAESWDVTLQEIQDWLGPRED